MTPTAITVEGLVVGDAFQWSTRGDVRVVVRLLAQDDGDDEWINLLILLETGVICRWIVRRDTLVLVSR